MHVHLTNTLQFFLPKTPKISIFGGNFKVHYVIVFLFLMGSETLWIRCWGLRDTPVLLQWLAW
jgi:hypothetical protein